VSSEEECSKEFYHNERLVIHKQQEVDLQARLDNSQKLTEMIHAVVLEEFPKVIGLALQSPEFQAAKEQVMSQIITRLEAQLSGLASVSMVSSQEIKTTLNNVMKDLKDSFLKDRVKQQAITSAMEAVIENAISPPPAPPVPDTDPNQDYWSN
jgi:hypothetical protein